MVFAANRLLTSFSHDRQQFILDNSETIELEVGDTLCESGQKLHYVYFLLNGLISLVITVDDGVPFELSMIGYEGMLGAYRVLGIDEEPLEAIVQLIGQTLRLPASAFEELSMQNTQLELAVKRYLFVLMMQLSRTAACTHIHHLSSRLACWLLMVHNRSRGDSFF